MPLARKKGGLSWRASGKDPTVTNTGANLPLLRIKVEWDAEIGKMGLP